MGYSGVDVPHNVEAEQQLLGALLDNSERLEQLGPSAGPDLFYDPVHAAIFEKIRERHKIGELVSFVAMKPWADGHEGVRELGGAAYLARLAGNALQTSAAPKYAEMLADWKAKRDLLAIIDEAKASLRQDDSSASTIAGKMEAALLASSIAPTAKGPVSMMAATTKALDETARAYAGEETNAISSGIPNLDRLIGGFYPGELILLAGRPSMGKTAVALCMASANARAGKGVAVASLEMSPESLAYRVISEATSLNKDAVQYASMRRGQMSERHMRSVVEAAKDVAQLPIQILPQEYRDIGSLFAGAKRAKALLGEVCGLRLLVVDYLQLLRAEGKGRYEQITEISIALKALGAQLGVPVLALSQLSRAVEQREEKRPMLSDLRESGQLEQDADTVLFCYRDEYYLERDRPDEGGEALEEWQHSMERARNKLEIIVAKQRQGEIGTAHVRFNPALNLIWD